MDEEPATGAYNGRVSSRLIQASRLDRQSRHTRHATAFRQLVGGD
jgi:hypothetical protein